MNLEKVVFGFFVLLAATLNFGFVYGDMSDPGVHESWELFAALTVSVIAAVLKFGDRTHVGAVHLSASLVALLQLVAAGVVWVIAARGGPLTASATASVVSLAAGALVANAVSVVIMVIETTLQRR